MPDSAPRCPKCDSEYAYAEGARFVCPDCSHEWTAAETASVAPAEDEGAFVVKDANGTILKDGDSVVLIKDLKLKGAANTLKSGTKVKNIRLVDSDHNIDCKIDGVGAIGLKSEFVRRA